MRLELLVLFDAIFTSFAYSEYPYMLNDALTRKHCTDDATVIEHIMRRQGTSKRKPIPNNGGNVTVTVEFWVQEVSKIIEITSEFELDLYVTEQWQDDSLIFAHMEPEPCKRNLSVNGETMLPRIWQPSAVFVNSKTADIHYSPEKNVFMMIYANGTVWINYRIKLTGPCHKEMKAFPMDSQTCVLTYESFHYKSSEVLTVWTDTAEAIAVLSPVKLPDFDLVDFAAYSFLRDYPAGTWTELVATFTFKRRYGFYILQAYVPAYLSVFISWVSFFLSARNLGPRTMVCVNSLLSLTFQFSSVVNNLPRSNDVKAIDVWILSCEGFIFASLLELAVVGYITANNKHMCNCRCMRSCMQTPTWTANRVDGLSMLAFPGCFGIFNWWYWFVYLHYL